MEIIKLPCNEAKITYTDFGKRFNSTKVEIKIRPNYHYEKSVSKHQLLYSVNGLPDRFVKGLKDKIHDKLGRCAFALQVTPVEHSEELDMTLFWHKLDICLQDVLESSSESVTDA